MHAMTQGRMARQAALRQAALVAAFAAMTLTCAWANPDKIRQAAPKTTNADINQNKNGDKNQKIDIYVFRTSVMSAMEMIGVLSSVHIQFDGAVNQDIESTRIQGDPLEAISRLARSNGLIDWYDGSKFMIFSEKGQRRTAISFAGADEATVRALVASVAPIISPSALRIDPVSRLITVSGPPELRDAISQAMSSVAAEKSGDVSVIRFGQSTR